jgi:hypothetical protein
VRALFAVALAAAPVWSEPARRGGSAELAGTLVADRQHAVPAMALVFGERIPGAPVAFEVEGTLALSSRFATAAARVVLGPEPSQDTLAATLAGGASFRADGAVWLLEGGVRWRLSAGPHAFTEGASALVLEPAWQGPLATPYPILIWRSTADLWLHPRDGDSALGIGVRVEVTRDGPMLGGTLAFRGPASHIVALLLEILRAFAVAG